MLTTDLQNAYQEFIHLFHFLKNELERQLLDIRFQSNITENTMKYIDGEYLYIPSFKKRLVKAKMGQKKNRCSEILKSIMSIKMASVWKPYLASIVSP